MIKYKDKNEPIELPQIPKYLYDMVNSLFRDLQYTNESKINKLQKIYNFLDEYGSFVQSFSVCSKGCSACCHIDVLVTELEAKLIDKKMGQKRKSPQGVFSMDHYSPCPFLDSKGECSIYNARPFNCRTFHTLDDPKYCETGEDHNLYGTNTSEFYSKLYNIVYDLNNDKRFYDIRDYYG